MALRMSAPPSTSSRVRLALLLVIPVATMLAGFVGTALAPKLLVENPALLIALDPRPTHLVLAAPSVPWAMFIAVGAIRWLVADPFFYVIGVERGPAALAWAERRSGNWGKKTIAFVRRMIDRAALPIVFFASGPLVCLLIGMNGKMSARRFAVVNVVGTICTMVLIRLLGAHLADPIEVVTAFVREHVPQLTAATCALVGGGLLVRWRRTVAGASS